MRDFSYYNTLGKTYQNSKASEKFHPLSLLLIFGERSNLPRVCELQTSKTSVPDLVVGDRTRV